MVWSEVILWGGRVVGCVGGRLLGVGCGVVGGWMRERVRERWGMVGGKRVWIGLGLKGWELVVVEKEESVGGGGGEGGQELGEEEGGEGEGKGDW